jgi:CelD/BcsL family acetyltransferase involved in cellulose biosynthesis
MSPVRPQNWSKTDDQTVPEFSNFAMLRDGFCELSELEPAIDEIALSERNKESSAFFPSSAWLRAYASQWPDTGKVYSFKFTHPHSKAHSYALISSSVRRNRLGQKLTTLGFNEAPFSTLSDIHIEKNGFLGNEPTNVGKVFGNFFDALLSSDANWDEIRFNSLDSSVVPFIQKLASDNKLIHFQTYSSPSYLIDFEDIEQSSDGDYLKSRSGNTRAQIRKSVRDIEAGFGPLHVENASSVAQALDWYELLAKLHAIRWNSEGQVNNFLDSGFKVFFKKNIENLLACGKVRLLKITAGSKVLAIFYYFYSGRSVYFYTGGVDYSIEKTLRPGIVGHVCAIQYFQKQGVKIYDFMEGYGQYKESLATSISTNEGWTIQKRTKLLTLEHLIRRAKRSAYRNANRPKVIT